jgi:uncharacterized protein (TIGR00725 family)
VGPGLEATATNCTAAREVGRLLAQRGAVVVTGGLGGVMSAAADGCAAAGGVSVGLLPGADRSAAEGALTVALPTGLGELRNALIVRAVDAVIAVGGSWGTVSEIALALRGGTPLVVLDGWAVVDANGAPVPWPTAESPSHAVDLAFAAMADT